MKGRELTVEEVSALKDGTKVWIEDLLKVYEKQVCIKKGLKFYFTIGFNCWTAVKYSGDLERIKIYEWLEEKEMVTYSVEQVIARIKEGQVYQGTDAMDNIKTISKEADAIRFEFANHGTSLGIVSSTKFVLVEKEVTFKEAVQAAENSKTVKCVLNGVEAIFEIKVRMTKPGTILADDESYTVTVQQILNGKWYIL